MTSVVFRRPPRAPGVGPTLISLALALVACAAAGCGREPIAEDPPAERRAPAGPVVRVGLERLGEEGVAPLVGRVGLVAHAASTTSDGRHAIDVLREQGVDLVRLFSPEHGLRGRAAAGEVVASGTDAESGLPVVSLYGERRKPSAEELADLDLLVFDLQDAGVRFYTYVSTLLLCLEAAAEAGVEVVVLDRPNPLGGERVEGPTSAPRERVPSSFVNLAPGPLVHGLTAGEMARLVAARQAPPVRLRVVEMTGWRRAMTWSETARPWVSPSPNLRSPAAALAYPGVALLESTNVSEGRGSERPFLLLGAPWIGEDVQQRLSELRVPGFALRPTSFVPIGSAAAPEPKHRDLDCHGAEVSVTDEAAARPYELGLRLLDLLRQDPGFEWRRDGAALVWLVGDDRLLERLRSGSTVEAILEADRADHDAWREARRPFLLYE